MSVCVCVCVCVCVHIHVCVYVCDKNPPPSLLAKMKENFSPERVPASFWPGKDGGGGCLAGAALVI